MMACRIQRKKLVVKSMRKPGELMPIRRISGGEGPAHGAPAQATMDVGIRGDILTIVQHDEGMPDRGAIESDRCHREQEADHGVQLLASEEWPGSWWCFGVWPLADFGARLRESFAAAH